MVKRRRSVMVLASRAPARRVHEQSAWGVSAEEPWAVCSCVASTALVGDEAELSACAIGFTGPVLLTARGGKELDPLRAKLLRRALGDPGGLVQTK